jgi:hypothetical protein
MICCVRSAIITDSSVGSASVSSHGRKRLERHAHDVVERLLRGERHAGGLSVHAQATRLVALRTEALAHQLGPQPASGAELRDLLEEVVVDVEEEREAMRELIDRQASAREQLAHVGDAVGEREGELLDRRRPRFADVVAADRHGVPARYLDRAELDRVGDQPDRRLGRRDPFLLRNELLQHVVLDGAAEPVPRNAALLGHREVHREQHRGATVDGHRGGDPIERNLVEEPLYVGDGGDRDALAADLAASPLVIGVVAHQRGHIEGRREAGLPLAKEEVEASVGVLGRAVAGKLAHRPVAAPVHALVGAAQEGI